MEKENYEIINHEKLKLGGWDAVLTTFKSGFTSIHYDGEGGAIISNPDREVAETKFIEAMNVAHAVRKILDKETILCAAIDYNGVIIPGFRHGTCYATLKMLVKGIKDDDLPGRDKQGFLTSTGRYVDRKEAWFIAKRHNQIKFGLEASENGEDSMLISENLY